MNGTLWGIGSPKEAMKPFLNQFIKNELTPSRGTAYLQNHLLTKGCVHSQLLLINGIILLRIIYNQRDYLLSNLPRVKVIAVLN